MTNTPDQGALASLLRLASCEAIFEAGIEFQAVTAELWLGLTGPVNPQETQRIANWVSPIFSETTQIRSQRGHEASD